MSPLILAVLTGCGGYTLSGSVQKGPYVLGSSISISTMNGNAEPTGQVFLGQTENDAGEFSIPVEGHGLASIEGNGYFYNEVTGLLSESPLTVRSLSSLERETPVRLNVITHLSYNRLLRLMRDGADYDMARAQAEQELRDNLIIGPEGFQPGNGDELSLLDADDESSAYLLAVSAVISQAALSRTGNDPQVAALQELMNQISTDLSDDGIVSRELYEEIDTAEGMVNINFVEDALTQRLADIGSSGVVPDLDRIFDTDHDGIVNREDNCALQSNPGQEQLPGLCRISWSTIRFEGMVTTRAVTGDFDEDGFSDIVASRDEQAGYYSSSGTGEYDFYAGDGTGHFSSAETQVNGTCSILSAVVDLNNDGHLDIACDQEYVIFGDGNGSFSEAYWMQPGDGEHDLFYGDVDNDGLTDVLSQTTTRIGDDWDDHVSKISLKYGASTDSVVFSEVIDIDDFNDIDDLEWSPDMNHASVYSAKIADINLDGQADIACIGVAGVLDRNGFHSTNEFIRIYTSNIFGELVYSYTIWTYIDSMDFIDMNKDGYQDIVADFKIYKNDTFGNFNKYYLDSDFYFGGMSVLEGDFSNLILGWGWNWSDTSGVFSRSYFMLNDTIQYQETPPFQYSPQWVPNHIVTGDFDSVGNEDLLVVENDSKMTVVLINGE